MNQTLQREFIKENSSTYSVTSVLQFESIEDFLETKTYPSSNFIFMKDLHDAYIEHYKGTLEFVQKPKAFALRQKQFAKLLKQYSDLKGLNLVFKYVPYSVVYGLRLND